MVLSNPGGLPWRLSDTDAAPFAEVLNSLRRRHSLAYIADVTGVSRYALTLISNRRRARIRRDTAEKLRVGLLDPRLWDVEVSA